MVVFVCSGCGQSLKKAQVETHVSTCSKCQSVSCIDCSKDFWGDEYKAHLKCITENEKYGGKNYQHKTPTGEAKQEEWTKKLLEIIENIQKESPPVVSILQRLKTCTNIPRRKVKFINYVKHGLKEKNEKLIEEVWDLVSHAANIQENGKSSDKSGDNQEKTGETTDLGNAKKKKKKKKSKKESGDGELAVHNDQTTENSAEHNQTSGKKKKRKKKRTIDEVVEKNNQSNIATDSAEGIEGPAKKKRKKNKHKKGNAGGTTEENAAKAKLPAEESDTKSISDAVLDILRQNPGNEIDIKKFREKVFELVSPNSEDKIDGKWVKKLNKKLRKMSNVKIENEKIQLISN